LDAHRRSRNILRRHSSDGDLEDLVHSASLAAWRSRRQQLTRDAHASKPASTLGLEDCGDHRHRRLSSLYSGTDAGCQYLLRGRVFTCPLQHWERSPEHTNRIRNHTDSIRFPFLPQPCPA
jgi:hypothetical protein